MQSGRASPVRTSELEPADGMRRPNLGIALASTSKYYDTHACRLERDLELVRDVWAARSMPHFN